MDINYFNTFKDFLAINSETEIAQFSINKSTISNNIFTTNKQYLFGGVITLKLRQLSATNRITFSNEYQTDQYVIWPSNVDFYQFSIIFTAISILDRIDFINSNHSRIDFCGFRAKFNT